MTYFETKITKIALYVESTLINKFSNEFCYFYHPVGSGLKETSDDIIARLKIRSLKVYELYSQLFIDYK